MLSSDCPQPSGQHWSNQRSLTDSDSFDITFMPRSQDIEGLPETSALTPRQRQMRGQLELPVLESYPWQPGCSPQASEDEVRQQLLELYQGFALDLHTGMYLTQLMVDRSYSDIHCQLMEDMATLKLDQSNGRIIEFPLANVSKVYRLTKIAGKLYSAERQLSAAPDMEQIVVVVFSKRKLAFVFKELKACQRFAICMELLVSRAQQLEGVPLLRSSGASRALPAVLPLVPERAMPALTPRLSRDGRDPPRPPHGDCKGLEELPHSTTLEDVSSATAFAEISSGESGDGRTINLLGVVEQARGRQRSPSEPPARDRAVVLDTRPPVTLEVQQADEEAPCAADGDLPELTESLLKAIACVHAMEAEASAKESAEMEAHARTEDTIARENAGEGPLQTEGLVLTEESGDIVPI